MRAETAGDYLGFQFALNLSDGRRVWFALGLARYPQRSVVVQRNRFALLFSEDSQRKSDGRPSIVT
jgi:hypothetical protein